MDRDLVPVLRRRPELRSMTDFSERMELLAHAGVHGQRPMDRNPCARACSPGPGATGPAPVSGADRVFVFLLEAIGMSFLIGLPPLAPSWSGPPPSSWCSDPLHPGAAGMKQQAAVPRATRTRPRGRELPIDPSVRTPPTYVAGGCAWHGPVLRTTHARCPDGDPGTLAQCAPASRGPSLTPVDLDGTHEDPTALRRARAAARNRRSRPPAARSAPANANARCTGGEFDLAGSSIAGSWMPSARRLGGSEGSPTPVPGYLLDAERNTPRTSDARPRDRSGFLAQDSGRRRPVPDGIAETIGEGGVDALSIAQGVRSDAPSRSSPPRGSHTCS